MAIHKPKPVHNWRELATEVGVIVVGIVIALTAEQFLQGLEWRHKISRAEEQMRFEMSADDGPEVFQRLALADCIDNGLAGIRASIERADNRAAVIEAINRVDIPRHTYESDAYHAAEVLGVLARLEPRRVDRWNYLYAPMSVLDRMPSEISTPQRRMPLQFGGPLSEAEY
jgi:hypothetical protein